MAGLIKNQILKHLSKFTKNVSPDSINISTMRGEGSLCNLELNEEVLTDLLELPSWLRITKATVNRVNLKISFTKLKSVPIIVSLDEVHVVMETSETLRAQGQSLLPSYAAGGKYGYTDKIIDGMSITINTVTIQFNSHAFNATFSLSRIVLDSTSPAWQKADLRMTRLKDPDKGEILIFKELSWQNMRIEARSTQDKNLTPLRLITNQARCRITLKKRMSDCSVMGCRLVLLVDDLLWVLTDSQLTAAFHFCDSLSSLVKKGTEQAQRTKAARKLELLPEFQAMHQQTASSRGGNIGGGGGGGFQRASHPHQSATASSVARVFNKYDVIETSYHLYSERIDLHFCDDPGPGRSTHPDLSSGAALQMTVSQLEVDYYPYHLAAGDRTHWVKYNSDCGPAQWSLKSLNQFKTQLIDTLNASRSSHTPLARAPPHLRQEKLQTQDLEDVLDLEKRFWVQLEGLYEDESILSAENGELTKMVQEFFQGGQSRGQSAAPSSGNNSSSNGSSSTSGGSPVKGVVAAQLRKLMSSTAVLRINDFSIFRVSTPKRKTAPKEFMSGDKDRFCLPTQMQCIHAEFTVYYNPGDSNFPVPPQKVYLQVNPVQITLDPLSILWLNSFGRNLQRSIIKESPPPSYIDVYMEAIMPRVIVEGVGEHLNQRDRPRSMHIQASRVIISNVRGCDPTSPGSLASLASSLEAAQQGELFFASDFPATQLDYQPICEKFLKHVTAADNVKKPPVIETDSIYEAIASMKRDSLWTQARDVLFLHCEPMWIDFMGVPAARNRPVPFVDAFPISVWMYIKPKAALTVNESDNAMGNTSLSDNNDKVNSDGESYSSLSADYKAKCDLGSVRGEAAIHMLVHTPSLVSIQLNHYQYLFLMRQLDVLTELTAFLTADTNYVFTHPKFPELSPADLGDSIAIAAVIPQVDVSIIMPPLHPCKDSLGGDMESFVPDSSSTADLGDLGTPPYELRNSASDHSLAHRPNLETETSSAGADILKSHSVDEIAVGPISESDATDTCLPDSTLPPPATANGNITHSADNTTASHNHHQQQQTQYERQNHFQQFSMDSSSNEGDAQLQAKRLSASFTNSNRPISTITDEFGNQVMQLNLHDNFNAGFSTMRKGLSSGLTNFMTTLESAVKPSPEDMSDTMSIRSDLSSDSDNFIMVNMESERANSQLSGMDALFRVENKPPPTSVEMASEVFEESTPSDVSEITSSCKRKDSIAVVTFKLSRVQVVQEARGYESVIKVQACNLQAEECTTLAYDEFQNKFSSRCRGWSDSLASNADPCILKIRLENNLHVSTDLSEVRYGASGAVLPVLLHPVLKAHVGHIDLSLFMSSVIGLVDLIEDEVLPEPLAMEVLVENVRLTLLEDRQPVNISSPGSVPIIFHVPKLMLNRNMDGVFTVLPLTDDNVNVSERFVVEDLRVEKDSYKSKAERLEAEVAKLQRDLKEANTERSSLEEAMKLLQEDNLGVVRTNNSNIITNTISNSISHDNNNSTNTQVADSTIDPTSPISSLFPKMQLNKQ